MTHKFDSDHFLSSDRGIDPLTIMAYSEMKESLRSLNAHLELPGLVEELHHYLSSLATMDSKPYIQEDIASLESQEERISSVSRQLSSLIRDYNTSLVSLARRYASISPKCALGPKVPDEVVNHVLEYIVEDGSHNIKPLLLVNKRFHAIIMSSPALWSKINITMDASLKEANGLSLKYINTCLKRSEEALLDINLDFSSVCGGYEYLCSFYEDPISDLPAHSLIFPEIQDAIGRLDENSRWMGQQDIIGKLIRTIMAHKHRWRSATVELPAPDTSLVVDFWVLFLGGRPSQVNRHGHFVGDIIHRAVQEVPSTFSTIENYTIWGPAKRGMMSLRFGSLRELAFEASWMDPNIHSLSSCTDLHALTISVQVPHVNPSRSPLIISLPSLVQLTLKGNINGLSGIEFQVPRLTKLTLVSSYTAWQYLPRVRSRFVYWHVITGNHEVNLQLMTKAVLRLLNEYQEMETLEIANYPFIESGVNTAREMMQGASSSRFLQVITFTRDDEIVACLRRGANWVASPLLEEARVPGSLEER
ncbi:hypothetical protein FS842_011380 [Serendipita sp. 407]|nr:hypothetical protein FS842_011380 [Serendipita sp. 407]